MKVIKTAVHTSVSAAIMIGTAIAFIKIEDSKLLAARPATKTIDSLIREKADAYSLDPDIIRAVIKQESSFNPKARHRQLTSKNPITNGLDGLNRAWGLCGIMGREAERRGVPWRTLENVDVNLELCASMLGSCIENAPGKNKVDKVMGGLACHYSGKPVLSDRRPRPGEPSPREYVQQVISKYLSYKLDAQNT